MTRPAYLHASAGIIGQMEATYVDSPYTLGGQGPLHYRDKSHRVESHRDHQEIAPPCSKVNRILPVHLFNY